jgi:aminoglycoside phosphotransferase (APT) family kinase protein
VISDALANLPDSDRSFNHGDLAGSNVLWSHGRVAGVLDWDLAAWDDPAEDVAALASWHGWALLPLIADPGTAARAAVFRRSFPLQIIAFAIINDRPEEEEISWTIATAQQRMSADAGSPTLP